MLKRLLARRRSRRLAASEPSNEQHNSSDVETLSADSSNVDRTGASNDLASDFLRQVIRGNPTYRRTASSDIRLIQILTGAGLLICKTEDFPLDIAPRYYALSYVWGDETLKKTIGLNGNFFVTTESVHDVLMQLRTCLVEGIFRDIFQDDAPRFWIDALCIDQTNTEDKELQIPRMHLIYGNAYRVFCWLGENINEPADGALEQLFKVSMNLSIHESARAGDIEWIRRYPLKDNLGSDEEYERLRDVFFKIIELPWFSRVWCIQEAVFARTEPIFMLGNHVSAGLHHLWIVIYNLERNSAIGLPSDEIGIALIQSFRNWRQRQSSVRDLHSFAVRLEYLMRMLLRGYRSSVPHDMIYAIISLAGPPEDIPRDLKPDYNKPFTDCFREYTRFVIAETRNLNILSREGWDLGIDIPSWVADFRKSSRAHSEPQTMAEVTFSDDGQTLLLNGTSFGDCIAIYEPAQTRAATLDERLEDLIPGYHDILVQFARYHNIPNLENTLRECFAKEAGIADPLVPDIMMKQYTSVLGEHVRRRNHMQRHEVYERLHPLAVSHILDWQQSLEVSVSQFVVAMRYLFQLSSERYMLTGNGILVHCTNPRVSIAAGDIVFAAKGCARLFMIRRKRDNKFQLLGTCDIIAGHSGDFDETFFANRPENSIWLI